jgi:hypothetical protein
MRIFEEDGKREASSQEDILASSFTPLSEGGSGPPLRPVDSVDQELEKELAEMKKELQDFEPTVKNSDKNFEP